MTGRRWQMPPEQLSDIEVVSASVEYKEKAELQSKDVL
jgi:hypothetical protein